MLLIFICVTIFITLLGVGAVLFLNSLRDDMEGR